MKKLFLAVMAVATIAMVGCKKGGNEPVGPVGPGGGGGGGETEVEETPEVAAPAAGSVTLVIQIPEGTECNGIAFKGTLDGSKWSGEDTYVSETTAEASSAECIKFAKVEGKKTWFQATFKLGEAGLKGKVCLIYKGDKNWQGQFENWEIIESYTTSETSISGDGNLEIATSGLVYVKIGGWQKSECAAAKLTPRKITLIAPTNQCGAATPTVVGTFNNWNEKEFPMTKVAGKDNTWEATIQAEDKDKFKFGTTDGWEGQIKVYDAEKDEWNDNGDVEIGTKTEFTIDYSAGKWGGCTE
ncbi:MAG: hypothetical protein J6T80_01635 [Paludibacteraceae bacterium]|nr:hypothetical protein [Paludibacteraceae bacterium]